MICIYTTFYKEANPQRNEELLFCLNSNIKNTSIDKVVVLNEGGDLSGIKSGKLESIEIFRRPYFEDFFSVINETANPDDISIIANTDIFFDQNIGLLKNINLKNIALAMARWDVQPDNTTKLVNRNDSQDVWIFKGKIKEGLMGNFPLGVARCDNRIFYELQQADYIVLNPSYSLKAFHLHSGQRSEYCASNMSGFVEPPYRYKYPHNLYSFPVTFAFNLMHRNKVNRYRYDPKKINNWLVIKLIRLIWEYASGGKFPLIGYN